ncbi:MAG: hypothetical protein ACOCXC_01175 [Fibrobacterota bacterium]
MKVNWQYFESEKYDKGKGRSSAEESADFLMHSRRERRKEDENKSNLNSSQTVREGFGTSTVPVEL